MNTRSLLAPITSTLLAFAVAACGNLTAGGLTGQATVVVSGDADTLAAAPPAPSSLGQPTAAIQGWAPTGSPTATGPALSFHEEVEGEIQVKFLTYLVPETGGALQLGDEEIQVRVDLRGRSEMDVVDRQEVPAQRYNEFRLIFTEIHAEVEGLLIDGVPVPEVDVELDDVSLLVSRAIDLDVALGEQVELVVDLNALAWLEAVDSTGVVDDAVFQDLVNVVIR